MKVGQTFKHPIYGQGGKCHVCAIVEDPAGDQLVFKYWRVAKKSWQFCIEPLWLVEDTLKRACK